MHAALHTHHYYIICLMLSMRHILRVRRIESYPLRMWFRVSHMCDNSRASDEQPCFLITRVLLNYEQLGEDLSLMFWLVWRASERPTYLAAAEVLMQFRTTPNEHVRERPSALPVLLLRPGPPRAASRPWRIQVCVMLGAERIIKL